MIFIFLSCFLELILGAEHPSLWWETFIDGSAEITLSSGKFTGNLVKNLGRNIEVFRG